MGTTGAKNILNSPASLISKEFPDNLKPIAVGFSALFLSHCKIFSHKIQNPNPNQQEQEIKK